jgi:hypothetical protein
MVLPEPESGSPRERKKKKKEKRKGRNIIKLFPSVLPNDGKTQWVRQVRN